MEAGHQVSNFGRVRSGQGSGVRPGVWPGFEF